MNIRHLRHFVVVAEEQNIGRAALRLHISQPPLTRQIQQLEQDIGVRLLGRTAKGVELTQAGALFLEEARNILALLDQVTERTQRAGQGRAGRIDVAIFGSGILKAIPEILLQFRRTYPDVKMALHTMTKSEQLEALRQRRISVGFNRLVEPDPEIVSETVMREPLMVAIDEHNRLAQRRGVALKSLRNEPFVLYPSGSRPNFIDRVLQMCHADGFHPVAMQEVGDVLTGVALVASGFGVCVVPQSASNVHVPGVVYRPLQGRTRPTVDLSCLYRRNDHDPLLHAFLETARAYSRRERDSGSAA